MACEWRPVAAEGQGGETEEYECCQEGVEGEESGERRREEEEVDLFMGVRGLAVGCGGVGRRGVGRLRGSRERVIQGLSLRR